VAWVRKRWTEAEDKLLREHYPHSSLAAMVAMLGKSPSSIYSRANQIGVSKSPDYWDSPNSPRLHIGDNRKPIGSTRICAKDGYVYIKVGEGEHQQQPLHRVNWVKANGPIPKGWLVAFRDGDKLNCEIGNLVLISCKENMNRNSLHNYPPEIAKLMQLRGVLTNQINKRMNNEQN
jgi:hypothetical protein